MGLLVNGQWQDSWYDTKSTGGKFQRTEASFRHWITADGTAGPSGDAGFQAEADRYHLYASYACPWAHRVLIYRALKGLESIIGVSFVHWYMAENGWTFESDKDAIVADELHGSRWMHEIYTRADPDFTGRVTVPVIWDKKLNTIVSNESSEIIRMLNSAFDDLGATPVDFYPEHERESIDHINKRVYDTVNNGVYKCGFATSQSAYDDAVQPLFDTLNWLEKRLSTQRFLCGSEPLEADWRLLPTLLRFDLVYHGHFKCNLKQLKDYPNLSAYTRDLYQQPGIAHTCNFEHAKRHYLQSHDTINPHRIVPIGPSINFDEPHERDRLSA
ncbi:MAG: glutathione S-transferase family protein [Granulosicoccus sp.]|nr:glutathione S-transferase family protein [Granulosicoccus sp.]